MSMDWLVRVHRNDGAAGQDGGGGATTATADPPAALATTSDGGDWRSALPPDIRDAEVIQRAKDVPSLAKSLIEAQAMIGAKRTKVPGKNAKPEELDAFYKEIGRPDAPDKYTLPTEGMPQGVDVPRETWDAFTKEAYRVGLTDAQAAALTRFHATQVHNQTQNLLTKQAEVEKAWEGELRQEFGDAFDERLNLAKAAIKQFDPSGKLMDYLDKSRLGSHPDMVRFMAQVGKALASDEVIGSGGNKSFGVTPGEAKAQIDALKMDKEFMEAWTTDHHPGHQAAVEKLRKLYEIATPNAQQSATRSLSVGV